MPSIGEPVDAIEDLLERYEFFLFDQFGVLHDGHHVYPGMQRTIDRLIAANRRIGVITNSGKRAHYNRDRIGRFGFPVSRFDCVVSSGEIAWQQLDREIRSCTADSSRFEPLRLLSITRGDDHSGLDGLDITRVDDAHTADRVLIGASDPERYSLEDYRRWLEPAAQRQVPALCTNPDRHMLIGQGRTAFAAGQIAEAYRDLGGPVEYIGKPWPAIYTWACNAVGVEPASTLCIGDSIEHDIAGARRAACASLLVATGIHAPASPDELATLMARHDAVPDWYLPRGFGASRAVCRT